MVRFFGSRPNVTYLSKNVVLVWRGGTVGGFAATFWYFFLFVTSFVPLAVFPVLVTVHPTAFELQK